MFFSWQIWRSHSWTFTDDVALILDPGFNMSIMGCPFLYCQLYCHLSRSLAATSKKEIARDVCSEWEQWDHPTRPIPSCDHASARFILHLFYHNNGDIFMHWIFSTGQVQLCCRKGLKRWNVLNPHTDNPGRILQLSSS